MNTRTIYDALSVQHSFVDHFRTPHKLRTMLESKESRRNCAYSYVVYEGMGTFLATYAHQNEPLVLA